MFSPTKNQEQGPNQHIYSIGLGASQELPLPNFHQKHDEFEQKTVGFGFRFWMWIPDDCILGLEYTNTKVRAIV